MHWTFLLEVNFSPFKPDLKYMVCTKACTLQHKFMIIMSTKRIFYTHMVLNYCLLFVQWKYFHKMVVFQTNNVIEFYALFWWSLSSVICGKDLLNKLVSHPYSTLQKHMKGGRKIFVPRWCKLCYLVALHNKISQDYMNTWNGILTKTNLPAPIFSTL